MNSKAITDFAGWQRWSKTVLNDAPEKPGVYLFRLAGNKALPRLKGESDLVYIGSTTKGKRTIRDRLRDHLAPRKLERNVAFRLRRVEQEVSPLEVSWRAFDSHTDAINHERVLLGQYERDHIEFPPLNRQEAGKRVRQAEELIEKLSPSERQNVLARISSKQD